MEKLFVMAIKNKKKLIERVVSIVGGLFTGAANGFFGGGGGMLLVPLLEKGLNEKTRVAHATAILIILPVCVFSAVTYVAGGAFSLYPTLIVGLGVITGGIIGALLLKVVPAEITALVFSLVMIAAAIKLIF